MLALGLTIVGRDGSYAVIPTRGADHFDELVGILLGWGVNFALCCDDDPPGRKTVSDFRQHWGLSENRVFTLAAFDASLSGKKIEGFLEAEDMELVRQHFSLSKAPTKSQVQLFFSEKLAVGERVKFSKGFLGRVKAFDARVRQALGLDHAVKKPAVKRPARKRLR